MRSVPAVSARCRMAPSSRAASSRRWKRAPSGRVTDCEQLAALDSKIARRPPMPPLVIPPLVKLALGAAGAAAVVHWAVKEARRFSGELARVKVRAVDPLRREA